MTARAYPTLKQQLQEILLAQHKRYPGHKARVQFSAANDDSVPAVMARALNDITYRLGGYGSPDGKLRFL